MKRVLAACAVALMVVVTGCGAQARPGAGTTDPAKLVPATALAYASFEIAPQGPERAGFDAAFSKLLGPSPQTRLGEAFTKAAQTSGRLDYQADVRPWLGETISAFVTRVARRDGDYALLVASTDDDRARAAIAKDVAGTGAQARSYRGVSYDLLPDGTANGVVDHFLVAGSEAAFKQVVDTDKGGNSLADGEAWKGSVGDRGQGKVGLAYLDLKGLLESLASSLPGAQRLAGPFLIGLLQLHPFVATLDAQPGSLVLDVSSPGTKADPRGPGAAASSLIDRLPADAWLAAALPKVGPALGRLAHALAANPLIAAQYQRLVAQLRAATGVDLERDVFASIGDVGAFVRGGTPRTVGGGVVVSSARAGKLAALVGKLPALIQARARGKVRVTGHGTGFDVTGPAMKQPVEVRLAGARAVAAYGAAATRAALKPQATLAQTQLFQEAVAAIGQRPTLFVDVSRAVALVAQSPRHESDPRFQQALPHLQHLTFVAVGARRDAGLDVIRAVVGLR